MRVFVTGGAGFIGSALVRHLIRNSPHEVLNLDKLTYAGILQSLDDVADDPRYRFVRGDVCDRALVRRLLGEFQPDVIAHLAAESHVDRSIDGPADFIETNIVGTFSMLEQALDYWRGLEPGRQEAFRFHHISTDEVFGSLGQDGYFNETTPYDPRSPYSASKAASDHLVRAWGHTFGLPVLVTNCSNNYGPYHFPEKLRFVPDRPGHDRRYAIDAGKIREELGWEPQVSFEEGIARTVDWYLERRDWWEPILARRYDTGRLGLKSGAAG